MSAKNFFSWTIRDCKNASPDQGWRPNMMEITREWAGWRQGACLGFHLSRFSEVAQLRRVNNGGVFSRRNNSTAANLDSFRQGRSNMMPEAGAPRLAGHEIVGERRIGRMPSTDMVRLWLQATSSIVKTGFQIRYADLEPPRTGTFDGLEIILDPDVEFEMQCFILLHLFGHSVQWVAPSLAVNLVNLQHSEDKEVFLRALFEYEFEAARYGMWLMHDAGIHDLDQWYSDFVATDWRYVERYYRSGQIPVWDDCRIEGQPLITPLAIPELQHKRVEVRFAF